MTVKQSSIPLSNILIPSFQNYANSPNNREKKSMTVKQSSIPKSNNLNSLLQKSGNSSNNRAKKSMTVKQTDIPLSNKLRLNNNIKESVDRNYITKKNTTKYENRMKLDLKDNIIILDF